MRLEGWESMCEESDRRARASYKRQSVFICVASFLNVVFWGLALLSFFSSTGS